MPDVSCNFKPPHICLEVLHLLEHGLLLLLLLLMGCIVPTNKNTQLPVKPDTYLQYGHIHTHRDTLDAISQSVTHDGVSHAMEMDVRSCQSGSLTVIREQSGLQPHCYYHAG